MGFFSKNEVKRNPNATRVPFLSNIPVEKQAELEQENEVEKIYESEKDRKLAIAFNNKKSNLRKLADYLWTHLNEELSYELISAELMIPENSIRGLVGSLNFYTGCPIHLIPVKNKKGFLQSSLKSQEAYEDWDLRKMKTITTMNRVRWKGKCITSSKAKTRKALIKVKVENEGENKA